MSTMFINETRDVEINGDQSLEKIITLRPDKKINK